VSLNLRTIAVGAWRGTRYTEAKKQKCQNSMLKQQQMLLTLALPGLPRTSILVHFNERNALFLDQCTSYRSKFQWVGLRRTYLLTSVFVHALVASKHPRYIAHSADEPVFSIVHPATLCCGNGVDLRRFVGVCSDFVSGEARKEGVRGRRSVFRRRVSRGRRWMIEQRNLFGVRCRPRKDCSKVRCAF